MIFAAWYGDFGPILATFVLVLFVLALADVAYEWWKYR